MFTKRTKCLRTAQNAPLDPCHSRRSHRSTAATGRAHIPKFGMCPRPVAESVRPRGSRWQGSACRMMSERSTQSIMTSDHRGFPDETSGRGVSVGDAWQGRSPAEHPPSLRTTLLPITIDVSRDVRQGSDSLVSRANRELQLPQKSPHHARSTGLTAQAMARSLWASGELGLS